MNRPSCFLKKVICYCLLGWGLFASATSFIGFKEVMDIAKGMGVFSFQLHPRLEKKEKDEEESMFAVANLMFEVQNSTQPQSRDAHSKGHGCVKARFKIHDEVPQELRSGVFKKVGSVFDAFVRFSNGASSDGSDKQPDGRGMAIKLLNVDSQEFNLLGTGHTQDFLLVNGERFFVGSARDYARAQAIKMRYKDLKRFFLEKAIQESLFNAGVGDDIYDLSMPALEKLVDELSSPSPQNEKLRELLETLIPGRSVSVLSSLASELKLMKQAKAPLEYKNAVEVIGKNVQSMVTESYSSMTSYLLKSDSETGSQTEKDTAVKYIVKPAQCLSGSTPGSNGPIKKGKILSDNYLREDLQVRLKSKSNIDESSEAPRICFNFYLQSLPTDYGDWTTKRQLVEDPRLDYGTEPILVGVIEIPPQDLDRVNQAYCDNLSFNPWQSLAAHQPLGVLNRMRKVAVTASSIRRHFNTGSVRVEPVSLDELYQGSNH